MKKPFFHNSSRAILGAFLSLVLIFNVAAAYAQPYRTGEEEPVEGSKVNVSYVGAQDGMYLFAVQFNNLTGDTYNVSVVDGSGTVLFKGNYSDKKFDKKFKLPQGDELNKVSFVIRNLKNNSSFTYAVNTNVRQVEEVIVKRTN